MTDTMQDQAPPVPINRRRWFRITAYCAIAVVLLAPFVAVAAGAWTAQQALIHTGSIAVGFIVARLLVPRILMWLA